MKHNPKITLLLLAMFIVTQFIGLYVLNADVFNRTTAGGEAITNPILSAFQPPEIQQESDVTGYFISIIIAFIIAIVVLFLLTKFKVNVIIKGWFFLVIAIALFITINSFFPNYIASVYFVVFAAALSLTLAFLKIFKRNFVIHNLTELLIYPGIATLFVPILDFWSILVLLLVISVYDMWAVWHSGVMQKMAKYQINNLKIFSGFLIPHISKKIKEQMKKFKKSKRKKAKINIAILGGGDIVFPMITAGVIYTMKDSPKLLPGLVGGFWPAIFVIAGATLGLGLLFLFSEKKKFYPAMPFITAGILFGLVLSYFIL